MFTDRARSILDAAIKEYIKVGEPITSEKLYRNYDFGIKPAMIRSELSDLSESGFLSQIHLSGGRLPTDKAYRFFVQNIIEDLQSVESDFLGSVKLASWDVVIEDLSDRLGLLSVGYEVELDRVYCFGLEELFDQLEFTDKSDLLRIVRDLDLLKPRLEEIKNKWQHDRDWPKVFIGENPITKSKHLSLIAERIDLDDETFFILAIGPKRMNYEKSLKLLKKFCHVR